MSTCCVCGWLFMNLKLIKNFTMIVGFYNDCSRTPRKFWLVSFSWYSFLEITNINSYWCHFCHVQGTKDELCKVDQYVVEHVSQLTRLASSHNKTSDGRNEEASLSNKRPWLQTDEDHSAQFASVVSSSPVSSGSAWQPQPSTQDLGSYWLPSWQT